MTHLPRSGRGLRTLAASMALLALPVLTACVYVPRTTTVYDRDCQVEARQMELEPVQVGVIGGCHNDGCAVLLVAAGATAVASAVVSGSIVVVGNIVYWFEKQGRCTRRD